MAPPRYTQIGEHYVLVVLAEQPAVVLGDAEVPQEVRIGERLFRDTRDGDHDVLGLYSWVRDGTDRVVGVAVIPDSDSAAFFQRWSYLPYVLRGGPHSTEILFRAPSGQVYKGSEENISTSRVHLSQDGVYAVAFDAVELLQSDIGDLRRLARSGSASLHGAAVAGGA